MFLSGEIELKMEFRWIMRVPTLDRFLPLVLPSEHFE